MSVVNETGHSTESVAREGRLPNFLYIGTSKAGSTWLFGVLAAHPDVFMAPCKGTYFFDSHFDRGYDWFQQHFSRATNQKIVGEISHSYLYSSDAARRIAERLPDAKFMVCLREPADRAFSAYLDSVKNGQFSGSFEEALQCNRSHLERGYYARNLKHYLEHFPRNQIHVQIFDDLQLEAQRCADELFKFLGVHERSLNDVHRKKTMPAARPRSKTVARVAKKAARLAERVGLGSLRGRAKRSRLIREILYRPYSENDRPKMNASTHNDLKDLFRDDIAEVDKMLGTSLSARWNYL